MSCFFCAVIESEQHSDVEWTILHKATGIHGERTVEYLADEANEQGRLRLDELLKQAF